MQGEIKLEIIYNYEESKLPYSCESTTTDNQWNLLCPFFDSDQAMIEKRKLNTGYIRRFWYCV